MSEAKLKIQAALGDASVDMLSDMGSIPITFTSKTLKNRRFQPSVFSFAAFYKYLGRFSSVRMFSTDFLTILFWLLRWFDLAWVCLIREKGRAFWRPAPFLVL